MRKDDRLKVSSTSIASRRRFPKRGGDIAGGGQVQIISVQLEPAKSHELHVAVSAQFLHCLAWRGRHHAVRREEASPSRSADCVAVIPKDTVSDFMFLNSHLADQSRNVNQNVNRATPSVNYRVN